MEIAAKELTLSVISIFNLGIGLFVLIQQPRRMVSRTFAVIASGIFIWAAGLILLSRVQLFQFNTMIVYGFLILLYGLVLFAQVFPDRNAISRKFAVLSALPLAFIAVITPLGLVIQGAIYHPGSNPQPVNGPYYPVFLAISAAYVGFGMYLFLRTFWKSKGRERSQMYYFLFGLSVFLLSAFVFDVLLPSIGIFMLNFIGPMSSIILTGATAYAIIRHQLMDIRFVIQRGLVYFILLLATVCLYVYGLQILGHFLKEITDATVIITAGTVMVFGIAFWLPLRRWLEKVTDPIFFKDPYDYADALQQLSKISRTSVDQAEIISASSAMLMQLFKTQRAEFRFAAEGGEIAGASEQTAISVPIVFEDRQIAALELGEKRSGDTYTSRDMQLLETFSFQAATALEKARLFQQVRDYSANLEQLVAVRTGEIQKLQQEQKQAMIDISHNLQTPLAIIRGELELLGEAGVEQEKTDTVRMSLDRVSSFIRQLLRLSQFDSSAYPVEFAPVDLAEIVREQADYFEVMADESGVAVTCEADRPAVVCGNKRLLEEMLTNLTGNAIKYRSPDRDGKVSIRVSAHDGAARCPGQGWAWPSSRASPTSTAARSRSQASSACARSSLSPFPSYPESAIDTCKHAKAARHAGRLLHVCTGHRLEELEALHHLLERSRNLGYVESRHALARIVVAELRGMDRVFHRVALAIADRAVAGRVVQVARARIRADRLGILHAVDSDRRDRTLAILAHQAIGHGLWVGTGGDGQRRAGKISLGLGRPVDRRLGQDHAGGLVDVVRQPVRGVAHAAARDRHAGRVHERERVARVGERRKPGARRDRRVCAGNAIVVGSRAAFGQERVASLVAELDRIGRVGIAHARARHCLGKREYAPVRERERRARIAVYRRNGLARVARIRDRARHGARVRRRRRSDRAIGMDDRRDHADDHEHDDDRPYCFSCVVHTNTSAS